jgi:hypothetical protein
MVVMPLTEKGKPVCWPCKKREFEDHGPEVCDGGTYAEEQFMRVVSCECECQDEPSPDESGQEG